VNNPAYPRIAHDYKLMFARLKALPCDVFLGAHGEYFGMEAKLANMNRASVNPFIDPDGYRNFVAEKESAFRAELQKQSHQTH
jgi:metallo-beta-lactamase class B